MSLSVTQATNQLKAQDTTALVLFSLYKLKDDPAYSTISELAYVLDMKNLGRLINYFGGLTIRIPTKAEFNLVMIGLTLYNYINLNGMSFDEAYKLIDSSAISKREAKNVYQTVLNTINNYEFKR